MSSIGSVADESDLHAFVDGCLGDERRSGVLGRLLTDRAASERVEAYRRQRVLLGSLRAGLDRCAEGVAPDLQRALADALRQARRRRLMRKGGAGLVAASIALGVGVWSLLDGDAEPGVTAAIVYEPELPVPEFPFGGNFVQHAATALRDDRERSLAWLAGHVRDQVLELPDLRGLGLVPVGGEVLDGANSPAIRLAWSDRNGGVVELYVGVVSSESDQAFTMMPETHVSLHWRRGRLVFALVGPAESPQLLEVVAAVTRSIGNGTARAPEPARRVEEPMPIKAVVGAGGSPQHPATERPGVPAPVREAVPGKIAEQPKPL